MSRLCVLLLGLLAAPAFCAVTCRIQSGGGLAFGAYDVLDPRPLDSVANVLVSCVRNGGSPTTVVTMGIGTGRNGTSVVARRMRRVGAPADLLAYGLYRDASRASNWGTTAGLDTVSQSLTLPNKASASLTFTIYGRLPARQDVTAGDYSDRVQITILP